MDGPRNLSLVEQEFQPAEGAAAAASPGTLAIDRAAQLLTLVLEADGPRALGELAGDAALPKSTASRLLGALERQGLIEQHGNRGGFAPGPVMLRFAHRGLVDRHLAELAQPHLDALAAASGETINLAVPTPLGVEHLSEVESRHFLGTGGWLGRRVPYHCTAVGKVLVAFGAARTPDPPLERLTPATVVDPERLAAELDQVRRDGCATAIDELETGLASLAAPVVADGYGEALAALAISGPTVRLDARMVAELRPQLIHEAEALGARLAEHDKGARAA
jgi:IclR family transcriptional regulator, acetate operon repressor